MSGVVNVWHVGRIGYKSAFQLQKYITNTYKAALETHPEKDLNSIEDTILIVEHNPVYTIGIRQKEYSADDETKLKALGAEFYKTNRGGLITFHGFGQLVVYPILCLKKYHCSGLRSYVSAVEETVIKTCDALGIYANRSAHTGVWVGDNKICAIGIHASRYITSHGLALNCNVDLDWFQHIDPCGIKGKGVTSLTRELGREVTINETIPYFLDSFSAVFKCKLKTCPQSQVHDVLRNLNNLSH